MIRRNPRIIIGFGPKRPIARPRNGPPTIMPSTAGMKTSAALSSLKPKPGDGYSPRMIRTVNRRNIVIPTQHAVDVRDPGCSVP